MKESSKTSRRSEQRRRINQFNFECNMCIHTRINPEHMIPMDPSLGKGKVLNKVI